MPKTIENCRIVDETYVNDISNDPELQLDLRTDELSKHFGAKKSVKQTSNDEIEEPDKVKADDDDDDSKQIEQSELQFEKEDDEVDEEDDEAASKEPKILITTHEMKISFKTYKLCRELAKVLPNAHYFYRKNVRLTKVIPEAIKRDYSAMIVINEDRKIPSLLNSLKHVFNVFLFAFIFS